MLIDTRITAANPVVEASGRGEILRTAEVPPGSTNVAVLNELLGNPEGFYINLHTTTNPGGAIRSQLFRTEQRVYGAVLSPANEVPAITNSQASGLGFLSLLAGVDARGVLQSAEVIFDVNYAGFAEGTQFTGMHIHQGRAAANGPVTIDTGLIRGANLLAGANGAGNLKYTVDVNMANNASIATVYSILNDPSSAYWNLHTVANLGGEIRAQLRPTEVVRFNSLSMIPGNEVPALTSDNRAQAAYTAYALRLPNGRALGAYMAFDVNYSFPAETTFTGLHLHQGAAGANGPVVLDSGIRAGSTILSASGFGNIYRTAFVQTTAQVGALDGLLDNPRNFYINLHTSVNPGGAVRVQMMEGPAVPPRIENVILSVSDPSRNTLGLGGLMTVYGSNIASMPGNLDGWTGERAPGSLNGVGVAIDGKEAPVVQVSRDTMIAQVPFETTLGMVDLSVKNAIGTSNTLRVNVARSAPAIFFDQLGTAGPRAVAFDMRTGNQMTQDSPAAAGMIVGIFGTGFGQSNPALATGQLAGFQTLARYPDVKVSLGGRDMTEVVTVLIPGYVGLTQTIFTVASVPSGAQSLEIDYQGAKSNRTVLYMR